MDYGPIQTYVESEEIPSQCPACHSNNIRQKGKTPNRRTFLHVEGRQLKRIILLRPRCECRDCKTTFYPSTYDFIGNEPLTTEAADEITNAVLEHPEISVNKVAKKISADAQTGSSSAIDRLVKKRVRDLSDAVQLIPCYKLFYIPFKYKKNLNCCAVVGFNTSEKKLYLLDILKDCSLDALDVFFDKIAFFKEKTKLFLADLNRGLLTVIKTRSNGRVGVLRGLVLRRIDTYQSSHFALDKKLEALEELKKAVRADLKEKYYYESFEQWKEKYISSEPDLALQLKPIYDEIISLKKECWIGTYHRPWEPEFTMLLEAIKICERNNASFDFMAFRLLYANRAATGTLGGKKVLNYVQNIFVPVEGTLRSFGVDIKKLYNELYDEEYQIQSLYQD